MGVNTDDIDELYTTVLEKEKKLFKINQNQIINGMNEIGEAYAPDSKWEDKQNCPSTYYEDAGHRCAYLHKYAKIHTALLCEILHQALKAYQVKKAMDVDCLKLCSLGSGPGTDIVASLAVLKEKFGTKQTCATLIDCCGGWKSVFEAIVSELQKTTYAGDMVSKENFRYEYVVQDLLSLDGRTQSLGITGADIILMVKFVSAAACKNTRNMVENIFRAMKPGALLLFVDNAAGGFQQMMSEVAATNELCVESVLQMKHYEFKEDSLITSTYCGRKSQHEAKVSIGIWRKSKSLPLNTTGELRNQFFNRCAQFGPEDFPPIDTVDSHGPAFARPQSLGGFSIENHCVRSETENTPKCCTIM